MDAFIKLDGVVEKSPNDDRKYRAFTLSNGLKVVVVSDKAAPNAAAGVNVQVGHQSDPDAIPGLAHFAEHMSFLGSAKYPAEDAYSVFLNDHGGYSNAYTASEDTNYHFQIPYKHLEGALDRFAQFFIEPLFSEGAADRELKAVDSENSKNLQNDQWRFNQLNKTTADPSHPYSKFGTGNLATLKEQPAADGTDIRKALLDFHATYYSASVMALAVLGREDLDVLERWVRDRFEAVPNRHITPPTFGPDPFGPNAVARRHEVVPVKDLRAVHMTWVVPEQKSQYESKPGRYLSHLIGHEGPGSILSLLKNKGWALSLCGGLMDSQSGFAIFGISCDLTEAGLACVDDIVALVYGYIGMLHVEGPKEWIWDEQAAVENSSFRFLATVGSLEHCTSLATNLQSYPLAHALSGPYLFRKYDPAPIATLLDALTPSTMRLRVVSNTFANRPGALTEKWYGTEYHDAPVAPALLERWGAAMADPSTEPALHLPAINTFIATDFTIRHPKAEGNAEGSAEGKEQGEEEAVEMLGNRRLVVPEVLQDDAFGFVFFLPDRHFHEPKLYVELDLFLPPCYASAANLVMCDLYTRLLKEALNEFAYNAEIAGLGYAIDATAKGLRLVFFGFNHKLQELGTAIAQRMLSLVFTDDEFARQHDLQLREYGNFKKEQPYSHAIYHESYAMTLPRWHMDDKLKQARNVTPDALRAFIHVLLARVFVQGVVHGNATQEEAVDLVQSVLAPFRCDHATQAGGESGEAKDDGAAGGAEAGAAAAQPLPLPIVESERGTSSRTLNLPFGAEYRHAAEASDPENPNSAMLCTFILGPYQPRQSAQAEILANVVKERFYNDLRTKQQLGYIVHSDVASECGIWSLRFIVQSSTVDHLTLNDRLETFLEDFGRPETGHLAKLTQADFASNVEAVVAKYEQDDQTLRAEASRLISNVRSGKLRFKELVDVHKELTALKLEDVTALFDRAVRKGAPERRKFLSLVKKGADAPDTDSGSDTEAAGGGAGGVEGWTSAKLQGFLEGMADDEASSSALQAALDGDEDVTAAFMAVLQGAAKFADQLKDPAPAAVQTFFTSLRAQIEAAEGPPLPTAEDAKGEDVESAAAAAAAVVSARAVTCHQVDALPELVMAQACGRDRKTQGQQKEEEQEQQQPVIELTNLDLFKKTCSLYPDWVALGVGKWRRSLEAKNNEEEGTSTASPQ